MRKQPRGQIRPFISRQGIVRSLSGDVYATASKNSHPKHSAAESSSSPIMKLTVCVSMVMFLQLFHYMVDAGPVYYLSKVWPILTLPLVYWSLLAGVERGQVLYGLTLVYVAGVTPVMSMIYFGNSAVDALATTTKIWPLTYYFTVAGGLFLLKPEEAVIRKCALGLGVATFVVMWMLWFVIPHSFYSSDPTVTKLFLFDYERGFRIYMPMTLGLLLIFYAARRAMSSWQAVLWWAVVLFGIVSMLYIYKQRTTIAAVIAIVAWVVVRRLPRRTIMAAIALGVAVCFLALLFLLLGGFGSDAASWQDRLGASWSVRMHSASLAISFLFTSTASWVFGVGSITRFSSVTLHDIFGTNMFYLTDIGWLGVMFEYGALGAILILLVYAVGAWRASRSGPAPQGTLSGDFRGAVGDLVLMVCLETAIYSPVFTPGIVTSLTSLLIYLDTVNGKEGNRLASS